MFGEDYCDKFNPEDYFQAYYGVTNLGPIHLFKLKQVHEFYQSYPSSAKLRILDIGSGPIVANIISAAPYAAEIVLSEYTDANRSALLQWLSKDPNAFDWTHVFEHIVIDLEGKTKEEVKYEQSWCAKSSRQLCLVMQTKIHQFPCSMLINTTLSLIFSAL